MLALTPASAPLQNESQPSTSSKESTLSEPKESLTQSQLSDRKSVAAYLAGSLLVIELMLRHPKAEAIATAVSKFDLHRTFIEAT